MGAYQSANPFQPYLLSGERILWTGHPKRGLALRPADAILIPFSLIWTAMVMWMFIQSQEIPDPSSPDIILTIFMALGVYFTIGRFIHDAAIRSRLRYAVTTHRILVVRSGSSTVVSLDVRHLPKLELTQYADGTGTIVFESQNWFSSFGGMNAFGMWVPSLNAGAQLFRVNEAIKVYELIRAQARA